MVKRRNDPGRRNRDEAARLRLRPILMTSFAFIMGVLPLVISEGAGAEMRRAMGGAVFSGMLGVTLFGLFLTPVFYVVLRTVEKRITGRVRPINHGHAHAVVEGSSDEPAPTLVGSV